MLTFPSVCLAPTHLPLQSPNFFSLPRGIFPLPAFPAEHESLAVEHDFQAAKAQKPLDQDERKMLMDKGFHKTLG